MIWRITIVILVFFFVIPTEINAQTESVGCDNRYLVLTNPVRGRERWFDKSLTPLTDQYKEIKKYNYPATWLIQYDALQDKDIVSEINKFDNSHEIGVFLEVSPQFTQDARVIYPHAVAWDDPNAIFFSGYKQSERRRLIDTLYNNYKNIFGEYPTSIGAWWIDSYTVNYIKDKYGLDAVLIVADQQTTDDYGVWGQWWGVPYYPSKANILVPASEDSKMDVVVMQWGI